MSLAEPVLKVADVAKSFTMHLRGGAALPVLRGVSFEVSPGECAVLGGPSGVGKSSILKMIYGNYRTETGEIWVRSDEGWVDVVQAAPRQMLALRASTVGYISQFLRVIPRVPAIELVATAARNSGLATDAAKDRAAQLLARLNLPERLWNLPPVTFSGGEQQRVNVACGFAGDHRLLLIDEPTASLDSESCSRVVELIRDRMGRSTAIIAVVHDEAVRTAIASSIVRISDYAAKPPEM